VPALLQLDRPALHAFMLDFFGLCAQIAASPVPIVAAVTGHSPAGGAGLSVFCDYRIKARSSDPAEPVRIGLNEVQGRLPLAAGLQAGLQRLIGPYRAERLMAAGAMLESSEALAIGFVDELADAEQVVARSVDWLRRLLALPQRAMTDTRRLA